MQPMRSGHGRCVPAALVLLFAVTTPGWADDALSAIPGHVTVAAYVQEWGQMLWGLAANQTGVFPAPIGDPITTSCGGTSEGYADADGTGWVLTIFTEGSSCLVMTLPGGSTQTMRDSAMTFDGAVVRWDSTITASDGAAASYSTTWDLHGTADDGSDDIITVAGEAALPSGVSQSFSAITTSGYTSIHSVQSDRSDFTFSIPMSAPDFVSLPDLTRPASGTYKDSYGAVSFTLSPTPLNPGRWAALLCDSGDGVTGTFGLNADFSGFGQVEQSTPEGPALVALVSWTQAGDVSAYSLDGQNLQLGPSGAALDFLAHRWETLSAFMGSVSWSSLARPGRPRRVPAPGDRRGRLRRPTVLRAAPRSVTVGAARGAVAARGRGSRTTSRAKAVGRQPSR
jgi:hypothetical protein